MAYILIEIKIFHKVVLSQSESTQPPKAGITQTKLSLKGYSILLFEREKNWTLSGLL